VTDRDRDPTGGRSALRVVGSVLAVVVLLGGAAAISYWIQASEPKAQREAATRRSAALVETIAVERGTYQPTISVLGAVRPAREIVLSPRVGGEVLAVEPCFRPGGIVEAGEVLLRLDDSDYELMRVMRDSEVGQVEAELAIERGQQRAAEHEFELLGENIDPANRSLVLREPQIASLRSKLKAAQAALEQARLDVARTRVTAPFDAQILERFTELGARVAPGDQLARLVGTDEYWVVATVPLGAIRWIRFPRDGSDGATARIHHRAVWPDGTVREGAVQRLIGEVDGNTRFARVIVSVQDPLGDDGPPLILGTLVQVEIAAKAIPDVVRLDRAYVRQDDTVWVMDGDELRIRKVDVAFADSRHAFVRSGLEAGDKVVTTSLATVVDGLPIREQGAAR
jgi:RND family efflux transporter MFP subunit